jgi:hypothetical protein
MIRLGAGRYSRSIREQTGLSPFRAEAIRQGKTPRVDVPDICKVDAPADIADRLGITGTGEQVVQRVNNYFTDDEPLQIGTTYIPWSICKGSVLATSLTMGKGSLYARFADLGHKISRVREEVTSRMPSPDEVRLLAIPVGVPVIELLHTGIDQDGRPFEATGSSCARIAPLSITTSPSKTPREAGRTTTSRRTRAHLGERLPADQAQPSLAQPGPAHARPASPRSCRSHRHRLCHEAAATR